MLALEFVLFVESVPPALWTLLTFCHGLEVHLATVAPVACHGASPHLEDIDGAGFEALHSDRVGGAFYGCGVVLTEILPRNREDS